MNAVSYSPKKAGLFYPARGATFFPGGLPDTEAALCAEVARLAYCRQEPYFHFDQEHVRSVLTPLGFTCQCFESASSPEGRGTHALLAIHDDSDSATKLAVVAFRGSDAADPTDLGDDIDFLQREWPPGGHVHRGFAEALGGLLSDIQSALDNVGGRILFTGHSLGAAMATLLATVKRPDYLYTFGSPRVGDNRFVSTLEGVKSRRFVNCCDIVTRLPPESLPKLEYAHFGVPYYINRELAITENPSNTYIENDRLIAGAEYLVEYAWRTGNVAVRDLADHAPINYVTAVSADATQPKLAKWKWESSVAN